MTKARQGDTVRLHYTGTLTTGETFDSSAGRAPLQFVVGSGQIIAGLDRAIPGMSVGDRKRVEIPCALAYGAANPANRQTLPRAGLPADIPLEVGTRLQMQTPEGRIMAVTVAEVTADTVTLDANHRLAGKDLIFDIEIMQIEPG